MMRARRGSALILVLLMTLAIAGLSIAAIFMSSSAGLLSTFYDREREFRFAAEAGLERVRASMNSDPAFVVPDTGMRQVLAGVQIADANGNPLTKVRVNVYAAVTGDTSATVLPSVTLIAAAYDAGGTRYVARVDLRRESFSRYGLLVDSFPSGVTHGPATVTGRVHSNGAWRMSGSGNRYLDTVTTVGAFSGTGTFDIDSVVGVEPIAYPLDSTYLRLDSLALAANLSFAPASGGASGSRLEFVAYDVDGDGTVEAQEGFARVFDAVAGGYGDTTRLRASPTIYSFFSTPYHLWSDPVIQHQCGAFYLRSGRWHFFPISAHRRSWVRNVVQSTAGSSYPQVSNSEMNRLDDYDRDAVVDILGMETARCFPAGSPYLMPAERMTNSSGAVTGTAADSVPFGIVAPPGGWPASAPNGYGGSDSTFTSRSFSCTVPVGGVGRCSAGTLAQVGGWRAFGGTPIASAPDSVVQPVERPYLWPLHPPYNTTSRGVVSATAGPLFVSGRIAGKVTLRVAGRAVVVDRLRYVRDPNDGTTAACTDALGLVATGDVLVVNGLTSRARRVSSGFGSSFNGTIGDEPRFTMHGTFMSLTGTVGVESPTTTMGSNSAQLPCPDDGASSTESNGGCLVVSGGMVMRTYSPLYGGTDTGFRYHGTSDRCQSTANRPPFFPLTNRYTFLRTLSLLPSDANTPAKIRTMLMRLKGKPL